MKALVLTILLGWCVAAAQPRTGVWKNYTSMNSVRAITTAGTTVWAASAGGVFSVDTVSGLIRSSNNSAGLASNDLFAIAVGTAGRVWAGASDGSVNVLDPASGLWEDIDDIRMSTRTNKIVRHFSPTNDTMFIVGGFGISVFLVSRWEFADTYSDFGFSDQPSVAGIALQGGRIWAGTSLGVASALRSSPNLVAPTEWTAYTSLGGLPSAVTSIGMFHDTVIVGTASGAAYFNGAGFTSMPAFAGRSIADMTVDGGRLLVASNAGGNLQVDVLRSVTAAPEETLGGTGITANGIAVGAGRVWIATAAAGAARFDGSSWSFVMPNGPNSNQFLSLGVDDNGALWAASGLNGSGRGFYRFRPDLPEGQQWKNFTSSRDPAMMTDDYYKVSVGKNGTMWISSWGRGVVELAGDTIRRRIHSSSTPSLAGAVVSDPSYVVPGSVAYDLNGQAWINVRTAVNGHHLSRLVNDTTFVYYQNQYNPFEGLFQNMVIDRNGTKWLGNSEPSDKKDRGLYYFNENGLVAGTSGTGGWGYLSTAEGLRSNSILCLAVDRNGDVWVGMDLGITIIPYPTDPRSGRYPAYPVQDQSIQAIAVDGTNNKWIGTKEGVFVVSSDGTQLIAQYTVLSTGGQLVDNDVRAIAIDQNRGIAYFGTEKGVSSLLIAAVQPKAMLTTLDISPNPFTVPAADPLTIRGLVESSSIKVLTASGSLVVQFPAQGGGRAFWDGKDSQGRTVPSGIYFVVAYSENGSDVTSGKVAVIRR
jgi:ligand-binding sensor domain-containing protein